MHPARTPSARKYCRCGLDRHHARWTRSSRIGSSGLQLSGGVLVLGKFKAVIRKRVPKTVSPTWLYFHINAPVSAICARAEILAIRELTPAQARAKANDIALCPAAVDAYTAGDPRIGCYELGKITLARQSLSSDFLNERMIYHPPQSFFVLSCLAQQMIDELAGFGVSRVQESPRGKL
jgi:hypothetical protein